MRLKPGYGYWETDYYPIGGCFRRAPRVEGKEIAGIIREINSHGCDIEVLFADGTKGACNRSNTE